MTSPPLPSQGLARASSILDSSAVGALPNSDATDVTLEKLRDALTPGFAAEFDPEEAERAGAFAEDALSESDALGSSDDLPDALFRMQPAVQER